MSRPRNGSAPLSRRRFVTLMAAGSAALVAPGGLAAATARPAAPRSAAIAPAGLAPVDRKEYLRQQASTRATLDVIRKHAMPPGTELASIFRPLRPRRSEG